MPIRSFPSRRSPALQRFAPVFTLAAAYVCAGAILRALLWWQFGRVADVSAATLAWIIPVGLINDLIESAYLLLYMEIGRASCRERV